MTNISNRLINWYSQYKRDLPWRNTKDPYLIWVSEIILQQTRINQGINYYYHFTETFPDIKSLANANVDNVLKIWQGLGYYSRARNMHYTAIHIVKDLNGEFPKTFHELKKLKGVGDYTAAAIASFSFNEVVPVIDGNVYRVLARLFNIEESIQTAKGKKIFFEKASELIDKNDPGIFNQAIMEFGSLQCTPTNPNCKDCPFNSSCIAYANNIVDKLPQKKQKVKVRNRYFNYLHIIYKNNLFIEQRIEKDIWKLLYQLPLIETQKKITGQDLFDHPDWGKLFKDTHASLKSTVIDKKHILSHQKIYARFYQIKIEKINPYLKNTYKLIPLEDLHKYSIPRLIDNYFSLVNK